MSTATVLPDAELQALSAAKVVDARGTACPGPLLEAKKSMPSVAVGDVIEVLSSDSGTRTDIEAWSGKVGHEFLGTIAANGYDRVFVRRGK